MNFRRLCEWFFSIRAMIFDLALIPLQLCFEFNQLQIPPDEIFFNFVFIGYRV